MLVSGSQLGKYMLGPKLGQGGFGVVFRAHDASLDRDVAIKFLTEEHATHPQILQRFLQEARSAAKIAHPGIVTVFECGQLAEANNAAYIAMELLEGESLTDRLARSGRLPSEQAMEITRQVASALEAAHRAGIVHRDLKPDNVFLVPDPAVQQGERIKILDFGIAKLGRSANDGVQTQSMQVFGTPKYMSPEQCRSAASVDLRSDIYTLGCILFELVCGRPPFVGAAGELIAQHVLVEPPDPLAIAPELPPALGQLITAMLAKEPDDRPPSMAAVQRALEQVGAVTPGVAPTLLPGMVPSAPRVASALGVRPSTAPGQLAPATPTTLGSAASAAVVSATLRPRRGKRAVIAAVIGAVAVAAVVAWIAWPRGGDAPIVAGDPPEPTIQAARAGDPAPRPSSPAGSADAPTGDHPGAAPAAAPARAHEPPAAPPHDAPRAGHDGGRTTRRGSSRRTARGSTSRPPPAARAPGKLTVTATPACDVQIDGGATLRTPIRGLELPAGRHRIRLANAEHGISETVVVELKAGGGEVVARDYRDRIKPPPSTPPEPDKNKTINPFQRGKS